MSENTLRFNFLVGKNEVPAAADKNSRALTGLASKTASFGKIAAVALGGAALAAGGLAAAGTVMGVKTAASLEQAQIGFTTLLGSSKAAGDYLAKLTAFAAATPFELNGLIDSSRTLLGVGVSAKDAMKILQSFGDAASAVGINQESFQRVMIATSQAIGAGKFQTADLNQIMNNGIPIWTILSRAMGKPIPELRKLASQGKLLASDVMPALEKQMEKGSKDGGYLGAMAAQSQTLAGLWSTLMDTLSLGLASAIKPLMPWLKRLATDGIGFLAQAFQNLPGMITTAMGVLGKVKDSINWGAIFGSAKAIGGKIGGVLRAGAGEVGDWWRAVSRLNWGAILGSAKDVASRISGVLLPAADTVLAAAKTWGGRIFDGINVGLSKSDWGPLGKTLGDGLITALGSLASMSAKLAGAFAGWFSSVDWEAVGRTVGGQAIPFVIGFVSTFFDGLITAAKSHPMDTALFILAFIPLGKVASAFGPLRNLIERLPLGSWITTALDHTAAPVFDAIMRFFKFIGKAFADGFSTAFPETAAKVGGFFRGLVDEIALRALYAFDAARNFVAGIASGMGAEAGLIVRNIGEIIADMVRPFAKAGGWLVGKGRDFVGGLVDGALSFGGRVRNMTATIVQWVSLPFRDAGGWLVRKGVDLIGGLIRGALSMLKDIAAEGARVIRFILEPWNDAQSWLVRKGSDLIGGLIRGALSMGRRVRDMTLTVIQWATLPFRAAGSWLVSHGSDLIGGFIRGAGRMFKTWSDTIGSFISIHVIGPFRFAARWLWNAGWSIIRGLWDGLRAGWDAVAKWIGGIGSWIAAHKGPISYDRRLLVPAGLAIMHGFLKGLQSGAGRAWDFVKSVGGKTKDELASAMGVLSGIGNITVPKNVTGNLAIGRSIMSQMGWGDGQWPSLYALWQGESGWNQYARNPSSGAYGIPQSLPAGKMAAAGADWQTNPATQIRWGLGYIRAAYGSPQNAYAKWLSRSPHWYDSGGLARGSGWWRKGPAPERVLSPRQTTSFERLVGVLDRAPMRALVGTSGGGGVVAVNITIDGTAVGLEDRVVGAVRSATRHGRLSRAVLP